MSNLLKPGGEGDEVLAADISGDRRFTRDEAQRLRQAGVVTFRDFVEAVSSPSLKGFDKLAADTGIKSDRLVELLPAAFLKRLEAQLLLRAARAEFVVPGDAPAEASGEDLPGRAWRGLKRAAQGVISHLLDVALAGGVAVVVFLAFRAGGAFSTLPPPLGLKDSVVIAGRDLKSGQPLRRDSLSSALLHRRRNYFTSADQIEGLILSRDVPAQSPVRREDLLRYQVVAKKDFARCDPVRPVDVKLEWKPFQPGSLLRAEEVAGRMARVAIRAESVVTKEMITPTPAPAPGPTPCVVETPP